MMVEKRPTCPYCHEPLSVIVLEDDKTGEIQIEFFCESVYDDEFSFEILTDLTWGDLEEMKEMEKEKIHPKKMGIKLLARRPAPDLEDV